MEQGLSWSFHIHLLVLVAVVLLTSVLFGGTCSAFGELTIGTRSADDAPVETPSDGFGVAASNMGGELATIDLAC